MDVVIRHCPCLRSETDDVRVLDYRHYSLLEVPNEVFVYERTLEELYLDSNQIRELPRALFHCHGLKKLFLSDNEICILPPAVASLINLEELDIGKNGILHIPENIKCCKYLSIIEASVNPLGKLPDGFTQLLNLTELYLNDTFLECLPGNFGRLSKLKILEVRENHLQTLPKSMSRLTDLHRLDIGQNDFTELPDIGSLTSLTELWCDSNQISHIPPDIGNLHKLMYLDASKNHIESIPPEIDGCGSLVDLYLSSNLIQELPSSLGRLRSLTTFKIDDNQLTFLPYSIGGLICLTELILSVNNLEVLPSSIGFLRNLSVLNADENFLQELPPELGSCGALTILSVRSNQLTTIPDELGHIPHLRIINLCDNRIQFLPYSIMKLRELSALWLAENQTKPLIPLQSDIDVDTGQRVLTCFLFPQQSQPDSEDLNSDADSFHPSLWEEERKRRQQITFNFNEEPEKPGQRLIRAPTPYPKEMKGHLRHAKNQAMKQKGINGEACTFEERGVDVAEVDNKTDSSSTPHSQGSSFLNTKLKEMSEDRVSTCLSGITDQSQLHKKVKSMSKEERWSDKVNQGSFDKFNESLLKIEIGNRSLYNSSGYTSPNYGELITNSQPIFANQTVVKEAKHKKNVNKSCISDIKPQKKVAETDPDSGYRSDYETSQGHKLSTSHPGYNWEILRDKIPEQHKSTIKDGYTSDIESYSSTHIRNNDNYPSIRSLEPSPSLPNFNLHTPDKNNIPESLNNHPKSDHRNNLSQKSFDNHIVRISPNIKQESQQPHCRRELFGVSTENKLNSSIPPPPPRPPKKVHQISQQLPPYPALPPYKRQGISISPNRIPPPYHSTPQSRKMGFPDYDDLPDDASEYLIHNSSHTSRISKSISKDYLKDEPFAKYENVALLCSTSGVDSSEENNQVTAGDFQISKLDTSSHSLHNSPLKPLPFPLCLDFYPTGSNFNSTVNTSVSPSNERKSLESIKTKVLELNHPHIPFEMANPPLLDVPGPQATSSAQPSPQENDRKYRYILRQEHFSKPQESNNEINNSGDNLLMIKPELGLDRVNTWLSNGHKAINPSDDNYNNSWELNENIDPQSVTPKDYSQKNKSNLLVPSKPKRLYLEQSLLNPDNTLISVTAYPWTQNDGECLNKIHEIKENQDYKNPSEIDHRHILSRKSYVDKYLDSMPTCDILKPEEQKQVYSILENKHLSSPEHYSVNDNQNMKKNLSDSPGKVDSLHENMKNLPSKIVVHGSPTLEQTLNFEWASAKHKTPHILNKLQKPGRQNYFTDATNLSNKYSERELLSSSNLTSIASKSKSSPALHQVQNLEKDFNKIKVSSPRLSSKVQMSSLPSLVHSPASNVSSPLLSHHHSLMNTPQSSPQKSICRRSYSQSEIRILEETFMNQLRPDELFNLPGRCNRNFPEIKSQQDLSPVLPKHKKENSQILDLSLNTHTNFDEHLNSESPVSLELSMIQKPKPDSQIFIPIKSSPNSKEPHLYSGEQSDLRPKSVEVVFDQDFLPHVNSQSEVCSHLFQPIHNQSEFSLPDHIRSQDVYATSPKKIVLQERKKMPWLFGSHRNATVFPVMIQRNPGLGFSISGGVGSTGNPFRPADSGIFVTKVNPDGPASSALKIGDKILEVNGINFANVEHEEAVDILKSSGPNVSLLVSRE